MSSEKLTGFSAARLSAGESAQKNTNAWARDREKRRIIGESFAVLGSRKQIVISTEDRSTISLVYPDLSMAHNQTRGSVAIGALPLGAKTRLNVKIFLQFDHEIPRLLAYAYRRGN